MNSHAQPGPNLDEIRIDVTAARTALENMRMAHSDSSMYFEYLHHNLIKHQSKLRVQAAFIKKDFQLTVDLHKIICLFLEEAEKPCATPLSEARVQELIDDRKNIGLVS